MKTKYLFGLFVLLILGLVSTSVIVSAYRGDYSVKGPNCSPERHAAIEAAFASLDYDAWHELMTEDGRHPRVIDIVNEDNFETLAEAHEAAVQGDKETAQSLRAQLGLNHGQGTGLKRLGGQGLGNRRR